MSAVVLLKSVRSTIVDGGTSEFELLRTNVYPSVRDTAFHHFHSGKKHYLSRHIPTRRDLMLADFRNIGSGPSVTSSTALTYSQHGVWPNVTSEDRSMQYSQRCPRMPDNSTTVIYNNTLFVRSISDLQNSYESSWNISFANLRSPPYNLTTKEKRTPPRR